MAFWVDPNGLVFLPIALLWVALSTIQFILQKVRLRIETPPKLAQGLAISNTLRKANSLGSNKANFKTLVLACSLRDCRDTRSDLIPLGLRFSVRFETYGCLLFSS
jgi:hypothetical protein